MNESPLKKALAFLQDLENNTTQEEFDRDWSKIKAMNLGGPTLEEYGQFLEMVMEAQQLSRYTVPSEELVSMSFTSPKTPFYFIDLQPDFSAQNTYALAA